MQQLDLSPRAILLDGESVELETQVATRGAPGGVIYETSVRLGGEEALDIAGIELARVDLGVPEVEVFRQGFYMPSDPAGFAVLRAGEEAPRCSNWKPARLDEWDYMSHSVCVLALPGESVRRLYGFTTLADYEGHFNFRTEGESITLTVWIEFGGTRLEPGKWTPLEQLLVFEDADLNVCLDRYLAAVTENVRPRVPKQTLMGWSDWQYYRHLKTEDDILANGRALQRLREAGCPVEYIVIDNGFAPHMSEWLETNDQFPHGMKWLSDELRKMGLKLGLWLAPYITNVKTRIVREHPDWLVMDRETGEPLTRPNSNVGPCCVVDLTVPEAMDWMRNIVEVWVREWGVDYIKLDGPALRHYEGGVFHDPTVSPVQIVRRSLEVIREVAGEDVIIEGEGIYGPSVGYVDIQRVQQDNWNFWYRPDAGVPAMKENMKNDLLAAFLHDRFWGNHRENVVLRDFLSPTHPRQGGAPDSMDVILPENELRFEVSVGALAGGPMLLTDAMPELLRSPEKERLISRFLPHCEHPGCRPVDVFQGGRQPSVFFVPVERAFASWIVVGVFNWGDHYEDFVVPLPEVGAEGEWRAFEFWTQTYLGTHAGELPVRDAPAHGCRVIALRRARPHPHLLGTDLHIFQGGVEIQGLREGADELEIVLDHWRQKDATLTFWRPEGVELAGLETDAVDHLVDPRKPELVTIHYNGDGPTTFRVTWG